MSIANGQLANQTNFNNAFASKSQNNTLAGDQTISGNVALTASGKGGTIADTQQEINNKASVNDARFPSANQKAAMDVASSPTAGNAFATIADLSGGAKSFEELSLTDQGELRLLEQTVNGTNYVGFSAPDAVTSNQIWKLPDGDGSSGQFLSTDGAGALSWGSAGASLTVSTKTTTYTATTSDSVLLADATGGAFTITLPAASGASGLRLKIKKIDSSSNAVTIDGDSAETIDGAATLVISNRYQAVEIICDGTEWHTITDKIPGVSRVQTKILSGNQTSDGTMSDLSFSNLVVGRRYLITGLARFSIDAGDTIAAVDVNHNSSVIYSIAGGNAGASATITFRAGICHTFVAAATTLTFSASSLAAGSSVAGNGSTAQTHVGLIELNNIETTTGF